MNPEYVKTKDFFLSKFQRLAKIQIRMLVHIPFLLFIYFVPLEMVGA